MKKNQNIVTLKIEYTCEDDFSYFIESYNLVLKFTYNRLVENSEISTKELTSLQKGMKHSPEINSHLYNSAIYDARSIVSKNDKPIIFGGKKNFIKRCQHKITKEEFNEKRLLPLSSVGEAVRNGNRLFSIVDSSSIMFKPDRKHHYTLNLINVGMNREKTLEKLIELQNSKAIPITYKLDKKFIYISFDYNSITNYSYKVKESRVIAIDMNPNYLGYSVVDWVDSEHYQVIESGSFSLKELNDYQKSINVSSDSKVSSYVNNKRKHEIIHIAERLFEICKHYRCEVFAIEDLKFKSNNDNKSKNLNRLLNNQWLRNLMYNQIKKRIMASSTTFIEVQPQYSSFIGNLVYRNEKLPDECLASIEIGRRGFEFSTQYIFNRRQRQKTVIFPQVDTVKNQLSISLAEIGVDVPVIANWKDVYSAVKKSEKKYRFSISDAINEHSDSLFSKFYKQRYLNVTIFV